MNINTLFKMQESFDLRILKEKNLTWEETFQSRILAFIDEVAECMKEWQGFKFWKKDNAPKTVERIATDWDDNGNATEWFVNPNKNPLLEEYVDGLHFAISLCIHMEIEVHLPVTIYCEDVTEQFLEIYSRAVKLKDDPNSYNADVLLSHYLGLGEMLGFNLKEIERAYMGKNKVNHDRQDNGY